MIQKVEMLHAVCDRCGRIIHQGWNWWPFAKAHAIDTGWKEIDDYLYCPDCVEWDEDTNSYKPKEKED